MLKELKSQKQKKSQKNLIVFGWFEAFLDMISYLIVFFGGYRFLGWLCGFWFGLDFLDESLVNSVHKSVGFPFSVGKTSKMMSAKCNEVAADHDAIRKDAFPVDRLVDDFDWKWVNLIIIKNTQIDEKIKCTVEDGNPEMSFGEGEVVVVELNYETHKGTQVEISVENDFSGFR